MEAICKADFNFRSIAVLCRGTDFPNGGYPEPSLFVAADGFHDSNGIWFFGELTDYIRRISLQRFNVDLHKMMCAYVNFDPENLAEGIHDISVYDLSCRLYKWKANTLYRGVIVLASDAAANQVAGDYLESFTFFWMQRNAWKEKLPVKTTAAV